MFQLRVRGVRKLDRLSFIIQEEGLKYVQIHDLDDSYNNHRVHCSYDLRLQIKKGVEYKFYFSQRQNIKEIL
jgi:hypothetical protein